MRINPVRNSDIARCPKRSLLPSHYRLDGKCLCLCLRCDKDMSSEVGVAAFVRHGHRFVPVRDAHFCIECGGNGQNTLTDEESRALLRQE